jgi:hypothetical protein
MVGLVCLAKWRCSAIAGPLVLVYFVFCSTCASAGTRRDDVADSAYTDLAAQPDFQSVGKLTSTGLGLGSGTLIDSRWVLTAGHMLSFPNPSGVTFNINGVDYTAAEWIPHSSWNDDIGDNGFDIGLIRLTAVVSGVTPALRYSGSSELGATATIVGYGNTGTGSSGWQSGTYGTKRAGNNMLDALGGSAGDHNNYLIADFDEPSVPAESSFGSSTPLALEYSSAPGDSGGGVFIDDGGIQKLAGVVSFGQHGPMTSPDRDANADYGDLMGFTRASIFNDWIEDQLSARYWNNASGGTFDTGTNWDEDSAPAANNVAVFNTAGTYTVSLSVDTSNKRLRVRKGDVTLDLATHNYTLANTILDRSIVVGQRSGDNAKLTLTGGGTINAVDISIGELSDSSGQLTLSGSGTVLNVSDSLSIGGSPTTSGGSGTLVVNPGATVQVANKLQIRSSSSLKLTGGTVTTHNLELAGNIAGSSGSLLTVTGSESSWTNGTISVGGAVTVASGGVMTISSTSDKTLDGGTLNIDGTAIWTGTGDIRGSSNPGTINVLSNGLFDAQNNEGVNAGGGSGHVLNNAGTVRKSAGTGTTSILGWTFNNTGTTNVQVGVLAFSKGGTSTGSFSTAAGATLSFNGGTHNLTGATFSNAGTTSFSSGVTANFNSPVVISGTVNLFSSTVSFNAPSTLTGTVNFGGATLGGTSQVTVNSAIWTGGVLANTGGLFVPVGGTLTITPDGSTSVRMNANAMLKVAGTAILNGSSGALFINGTAPTVQIDATGVFDLQSTVGFDNWSGGGGTVNNAGTFRKSINTGTASVSSWTFNNTGATNVQAGVLTLGSGGTSTGSFSTAAGATLNFSGGTHNLTAATFSNAGTTSFSGGVTANFNSPVAIPGTVNLSGGTLGGTGQVTINNATWTGSTLANTGGLFVPAGSNLTITPNDSFSVRMNANALLRVAGNAILNGSSGALFINGTAPTLQIDSTGVFDLQSTVGFANWSGSGGSSVNNSGTFRKTLSTGAASVSSWTFNNTGTVEVQSGTLTLAGSVTQLSSGALTDGTWNVLNGSTLSMSAGSNITTLGAGATVRLSGATATFAKVNTLTTNNGTFQIDSGKNFTVTSTFTNNGTLNVGNGSTFTANDISHSAGAGPINVQSGGNLLANHLRANASTIDGTVTVRPNGGAVGTSKVESLSIGSGGKLNLRNNDLVVGTGDMLEIRALIKAGISGVTNTAAASGITSDMMTKNVHGFGYAAGNDSHISSLLSDTHTLSGRSYDADSVLVKFTYRGDADLDGDSDLGDLGFWADSFTGDLGGPVSPVTLWTQGDWDYDGDTDLDDLGFWSGTFTGDLGGGGLSVYAPNAPAGAVAALSQMGITAVPEAGTVSLLGIGMLALAMRRRRLVAR